MKLYDPSAEDAAILAAVGNVHAFDLMATIVGAEDFAQSFHAEVWRFLSELRKTAKQWNVDTIISAARVAGLDFSLLQGMSYGGYAGEETQIVAQVIAEYSRRRAIASAGEALTHLAQSPSPDNDDVARILRDLSGKAAKAAPVKLGDAAADTLALMRAWATGNREDVFPTGIKELDSKLGGGLMMRGLNMLIGRPGSFKTTLAMMIAERAARAGIGSVIFSLEMPREELLMRLVAANCGINIRQARSGEAPLMGSTLDAVERHMATIASLPLYVLDVPQRLGDLELHIASMATAGTARFFVVDYAERIVAPGQLDNPVVRMGTIYHALKNVALAHRVGILLVAQVSRATEADTHRVPRLSDIRWGGDAEAAADVVLAMYDPYAYVARGESDFKPTKGADPEEHTLYVLVLKVRTGGTWGMCKVGVDRATGKLYDVVQIPLNGDKKNEYEYDDIGRPKRR